MVPGKKVLQEEVTLREHLERIIDDQKELFVTKLEATEQSRRLAKDSVDARLEIMNEFRSAMADQANRMTTKEETKQIDKTISELRGQLAKTITREESRSSLEKMESSVKSLEITRATLDGKASQISAAVATTLSVLALLVSIVLHFVK